MATATQTSPSLAALYTPLHNNSSSNNSSSNKTHVTHHNASTSHKVAMWERVLAQHSTAATCAAVSEIALFHPFDTAAKRLMAHTGPVPPRAAPLRTRLTHAHDVLFAEHARAPALRKLVHLYPGSCYAVVYKIMQRVYKFAGQPVVRDYLDRTWPVAAAATAAASAVQCNGNACTIRTTATAAASGTQGRRDRVLTDAVAGCIIGAGEVVLLPFDRLKVLSQTSAHTLRDGLLPLLRREGVRGMYAGTLVTVCRNVPGSFCLFGGAAFTRSYVLRVRDRRRATVLENLCASTVGALLSIAMTNPMDVVKTRVQRQMRHAAAPPPLSPSPAQQAATSATTAAAGTTTAAAGTQRFGAVQVAARMLREEGVRALFKGLTPKLLATAPKLVFAYTMTECIYNATNRRLRARTNSNNSGSNSNASL